VRRPRLSLVVASLSVAALTPLAGCGAEKQDRPEVVSTFPADGEVVPGWLAAAHVTFDDRVTVLNEDAASCSAEGLGGGSIPVRVVADPSDPFSVFVIPSNGGHFVPDALHHCTIHEGAVVNGDQHYALDESRFEFTLGARPNLFVTAEDGAVHEIDPLTGASVSTTLPPAGFAARTPFGTHERIWVWLDPAAPGSSALGTFVPGDAAITEIVTLSGETGTVTGGLGMVLSLDGRTLFLTAEDAGTSRAFLHRVDVATRTEIVPSLVLSPTLAGAPATFGPALDTREDRVFVPFSDGAGGGLVALVDVETWVEVDAGPAPGVDALPVEAGAGNAAYEREREHVYMVLSNETIAGIVRLTTDDDPPALDVGTEPTPGRATTVLPLPDGGSVLYGLEGYVDREGVVRAAAGDVDSGTEIIVVDDVGAGSVGADRVVALLLDPGDRRFLVFVENGVTTVLVVYDWDGDETRLVDFDAGVDGAQGLDLGPALGGSIATGATTLTGAFPP
jgi:hypothetical protein